MLLDFKRDIDLSPPGILDANAEGCRAGRIDFAPVKAHLRVLFAKFGIEQLPQNQKRTRLVERAFLSGVISEHDL